MTQKKLLEECLDTLLTRVRWYVCRGYRVPDRTREVFNFLCDATGKPHDRPWQRIRAR